ncbi:ComEC family competence protein [Bythopirellula polymerisocia]|uniref:ComEC family competence protein n=1 Tax=Bythopirellula polymerisocia TaxID=2528003 RepID=A0A5C6CKX8_9BACT|nr:ComEC family competence protein [Bythopirellula polymerisocia]
MLLVVVFMVAGILTDHLWGQNLGMDPVTWWLIAVGATSATMTLLNFGHTQISVVALLLAVGALGGTWHHYRWNTVSGNEISRYAPALASPVCVEAIATGPIHHSPAAETNPLRAIPSEPQSQLFVLVTRIRDGTTWQTTNGRARVRINGTLRKIVPGERLLIFGKLGKSRPAINPGQYDYAAAERSADRLCELYTGSPECVTVVEHASTFSPDRWLAAIGNRCQSQLERYVGSSSGPIAQALLLGTRSELSDETLESFMKTGTIHLLVVSGLHVGLLAAAVWLILKAFQVSQKWSLLATALLIIPYAAIVGGGPPVVRASVLVLMTLLGIAASRSASVINLLAASALVVLAINPGEVFRGGTQLSFVGVAVVVGCARSGMLQSTPDPLQRMIASYMTWQELTIRWFLSRFKALAIASFLVWVLVAPLVLYHFNIITPSGFLITPVLWPFVAVALVAGLGVCTVGFVFPPVAWLLGLICGYSLLVTESTVGWASQWKWGHAYAPGPPLWWLIVFYGGLAMMAVVPQFQFQTKRFIAIAALWVAVGFGAAAWHPKHEDELRCTFLAVGHGTCVVLEFPGGQTMLYDSGSLGSPESAANIVSGFLWSRGISHIDAIVVSHADVDHYNAVPGILERFDVGAVYVSPLMFDPWANDGDLTAPNFLKQTIIDADVHLREVWMNDRLRVADSDISIEILHPPRLGVPGRDNANSILLAVEFADTRILLPGDLESPGIEGVLAEPALDTDILLAPHHGSRFSDPPGFAAWCTPDWVVMSGGPSVDYTSFASSSYQAAGAEILHTAQCGAVEFKIGPNGVSRQLFLGD